MKYVVLLMMVLVFAGSCGKYQVHVDKELQPYFERFAEEASKRGVIFNNDEAQIEGYIDVLNNPSAVDLLGYCQYPNSRLVLHTITIDEIYWSTATDLQKEYLVFHELGHCFLEREHVSPVPVDSLGYCGSIMAAGNASCKGINVYGASERRRAALLDELFLR